MHMYLLDFFRLEFGFQVLSLTRTALQPESLVHIRRHLFFISAENGRELRQAHGEGYLPMFSLYAALSTL